MKTTARLITGLLLVLSLGVSYAQVPAILGTWSFNAKASRTPGPAPQSHVRSYRLDAEGLLVGIAVIVDAEGRPSFLQFAAKPDGKDYPEFDNRSAAAYLSHGVPPPRTYAEIPTSDPRKVKWVDKADGKVLASGEKWVSADGSRLSFTEDAHDEHGAAVQYLYVFDRTGP